MLFHETGVPMVIGMNGNVGIESSNTFMKELIRNLGTDLNIDKAVCESRFKLKNESDDSNWWRPVVYSNHKTGKLWNIYSSNFNNSDMPTLEVLKRELNDDECIPVIGSFVDSPILGTKRRLARNWGRTNNFPLFKKDKDEITKISHYDSVINGNTFKKNYLRSLYKLAAYIENPEINEDDEENIETIIIKLDKIIKESTTQNKETYKMIAELNSSIYITASHTDQLYDALIKEDKMPYRELSRWNNYTREREFDAMSHIANHRDYIEYNSYKNFVPTFKTPLVFHLFGRYKERESLVLTEDDYFKFLLSAKDPVTIPKNISGALTNQTLMLLGFECGEWDLRILLNLIKSYRGFSGDNDLKNIVTTVEPNSDKLNDSSKTKTFMEKYFIKEHIHTYWADVHDFLQALKQVIQG